MYSEPLEALVERGLQGRTTSDDTAPDRRIIARARWVVVGSGYGGAVAAFRLGEAHRRAPAPAAQQAGVPFDDEVLVLERGGEYLPGDFPPDLAHVPNNLRYQLPDGSAGGSGRGLYDLRMGDGVDALVGNGLGGGSLINANVAVRPDDAIFARSGWPAAIMQAAHDGTLAHHYDTVSHWLGATRDESLRAHGKYRALERLANGLGQQAEIAPIAVTRGTPGGHTPNAAGIPQPHCTNCGSCVSGCNVGAKNTLAMNLIPAAWQRGVRFVTNACVVTLTACGTANPAATADGPTGPRWRITVRPTDAHDDVTWIIEADNVVLAAGAFGSTEILLRSREFANLDQLSPALGTHFSTNGDAIAMAYAGTEPVSAIGTERFAETHDCGPTISTMVRGTLGNRRFTLEDAAIPAPLQALYGELVVFAAQVGRLGEKREPAWFTANPEADPIAVHPQALRNSQTLLLMTEDAANGTLELRSEVAASSRPWSFNVVPRAHGTANARADAHLEAFDQAMQALSYGPALAGAQYVANPMWRPLPKAAAGALLGDKAGERLVTVHPLGGCPMADRWQDGVVDADGRVFAGDGGEVYAGLYVLDGAIVPTSLGTNPFLTIAALAWRACDALLAGHAADSAPPLRPLPPVPFPKVLPEVGTDGALCATRTPTELMMRERLVGTLDGLPRGGANALVTLLGVSPHEAERLIQRDGLVLDIRTEPEASEQFVNGSGPVRVRASLYVNPIPSRRSETQHAYGMPDEALAHATCIASGTGTLTALTRVHRRPVQRALDKANSLFTYFRRRGASVGNQSIIGALRGAPQFLRIAAMQAQRREFAYALDLRSTTNGTPVQLRGSKVIAWHSAHARLWDALTHVRLTLCASEQPTGSEPVRNAAAAEALPVDFVVDTEHMFGEGLITTARAEHGPDIVTKVIALGGRFARAILQTSFWEFGGVDYPAARIPRDPHPRPLRTNRGEVLPVHVTTLLVPRFVPRADTPSSLTVPIALTRYPRPGAREHVVLVHGLAQGSLIYCSDKIGTSMAAYLWEQGYDVWLVDYRLSNRFEDNAANPKTHVPFDGWCMDEIGLIDMPAAIGHVVQATGKPVHVFAHCVGAVGMEIAVATGRLGTQHIASLTLNAIHPWVRPGAANRVRAKLGVFFRDVLDNDLFDPVPQAKHEVGVAQSLLDRFAFSFARIDEEAEDVHGTSCATPEHAIADAICDRMTFLYGRMWRHVNIAPALHLAWKDIVGRAPGAVFRHMYYMLINNVVLNANGEHVYMTDANVHAHWQGIPTLFLHGEESDVFNPQSATESALRLFHLVDPQRHTGSFADATMVKLLRVPAYGHMDVIFGKHAHRDVFPKLHAFFQDPAAPNGKPFDDARDSQLTIALPRPARIQLRGAHIDDEGMLALRYVGTLPAIATPVFNELQLLHPTMQVQPSFRQPQANHDRFRVVDTRVHPEMYSPPGVAAMAPFEHTTRVFSLIDSTRARAAGEDTPHWLRRLLQRRAQGGAPLPDMHFIAGACLYPGTPFDRNVPERIFAAMAKHMTDEPVDLLLLVGDQIYADATAGLMDPAALYDRYTDRYEAVLQNPVIGHTLLRVPTHVTLDDHEITDNFAGVRPPLQDGPVLGLDASLKHRLRALRSGIVEQEQFDFARGTAVGFMGSGRDGVPFAADAASPSPLWYALDVNRETNCPVFIADTRTERTIDPSTGERTLFGTEQFEALRTWLAAAQREQPTRPKFIVCGSVIAPNVRDYHQFPALWRQEDGFVGYPKELGALFEQVAQQRIHGVVFIGGDLHLSAVAEISLRTAPEDEPVQVLQIVTSGLYAPLPFTNTDARYYEWGMPQPACIHQSSCVAAHYTATPLTTASSHFVKVDAHELAPHGRWSLRIRAVDNEGKTCGEVTRQI